MPTYSVDWDIIDPAKSRQVNDAAFVAEREAQSPIGRGWCPYWDVGLIRYTDEQEHAHLLWVSDARSTRSHLVSVDSLDVAGVCFWLLSGDEDPAIWQAVREHFARDVACRQTREPFVAGIGRQRNCFEIAPVKRRSMADDLAGRRIRLSGTLRSRPRSRRAGGRAGS